MSGRGPQSRCWLFTYNNPEKTSDEIRKIMTQSSIQYAIFQGETAPTTGTKHFQGFVICKKRQRSSFLQKLIKCTWLVMRGDSSQAAHYCKKPIDGCDCSNCKKSRSGPANWSPLVEIGQFEYISKDGSSGGQKKADNLKKIFEQVRSGEMTVQDVVKSDDSATYIRNYRGFDAALRIARSRPRPFLGFLNLRCVLLYGPPGSGKSAYGHVLPRMLDGAFVPPHEHHSQLAITQWMSPLYSGQNVVHLREFKGAASQWPLARLLDLTDIYGTQVEIKNGHVEWSAEEVRFDTNSHPSKWYEYTSRQEEYDALIRRFHAVYYWRSAKDGPYMITPDDTSDWSKFWDGPFKSDLVCENPKLRDIAACDCPFCRTFPVGKSRDKDRSDPYLFMPVAGLKQPTHLEMIKMWEDKYTIYQWQEDQKREQRIAERAAKEAQTDAAADLEADAMDLEEEPREVHPEIEIGGELSIDLSEESEEEQRSHGSDFDMSLTPAPRSNKYRRVVTDEEED